LRTNLMVLTLLAAPMFAADPLSNFYDGQLKEVESDIMSLASAMPADKYNFAPTSGAFTGVRTFAQQAKHIASIMYMVSAAALKQKPPVDLGGEDGPDSIRSKAEVIDYLRGAFAFAHKSIATLTTQNQLETIKSPFEDATVPRVFTANIVTSHSFDHYGQMVVYARMNGVVPPASLPAAPAPAK
jgi:hypothetical protein